eukprot:scaffold11564_cov116-Isochrysis_galbana.AAC.1
MPEHVYRKNIGHTIGRQTARVGAHASGVGYEAVQLAREGRDRGIHRVHVAHVTDKNFKCTVARELAQQLHRCVGLGLVPAREDDAFRQTLHGELPACVVAEPSVGPSD